jgi:large subunit ribosomal protein L10
MSLMLPQKKEAVDKLKQVASQSTSVMVADYRGLKSSDMTELRAKLRQIGKVSLHVVRNTLAKRAFFGTNYEELIKHLHGPVVLAFADQDACATTAKLFRDFAKEKDKLSVTALLIEGKLLPGNQLESIANLPTKQEAITSLVTVMQAPIAKFVRTLAEPTAKLVRTFVAVSEQKQ